jgi:hypothetical protein
MTDIKFVLDSLWFEVIYDRQQCSASLSLFLYIYFFNIGKEVSDIH